MIQTTSQMMMMMMMMMITQQPEIYQVFFGELPLRTIIPVTSQ